MTYEAVLFDFAGVLTQPMLEAFAPAALASGHDLSTVGESVGSLFLGDGDTDSPTHQLERGQLTLDQFFDTFPPETVTTMRDFLTPGSPHYLMTGFQPHREMLDLVRQCRAQGLATAIVSNIVLEWVPAWEAALPQPELFDEVVFSCHVGHRKPGPEIYRLTLERLGVPADRAIFLDDSSPMVQGATSHGLTGIHVTNHAHAIAQVQQLLS